MTEREAAVRLLDRVHRRQLLYLGTPPLGTSSALTFVPVTRQVYELIAGRPPARDDRFYIRTTWRAAADGPWVSATAVALSHMVFRKKALRCHGAVGLDLPPEFEPVTGEVDGPFGGAENKSADPNGSPLTKGQA